MICNTPNKSNEFLWYETVDSGEPLSQGDFINSCKVIIPKSTDTAEKIKGEIEEYDVIVMSQSCDLANKKIDFVLVCPIWTLKNFEDGNSFYKDAEAKELLRKGFVSGYHLLNKCELNDNLDFIVVDFRTVYSIPFVFLNEMAVGKRIRLLPPYREHMSQAFGKFFMRVGLPVDIPKFEYLKKKKKICKNCGNNNIGQYCSNCGNKF